MQKMRLPNGYGQITKIKRKLRNPYRVRVCTERDKYGFPSKYITVGYFPTYTEAHAALIKYHESPTLATKATLEDVYNLWLPQFMEDRQVSESRIRQILWAWDFITLKKANVKEILPSDIRAELIRPNLPKSAPKHILIVLDNILSYAEAEKLTQTNVARQVSIPRRIAEADKQKRKKHAFTDKEIAYIKDCALEGSDILYYSILSGWRPSEVLSLRPVDVNIKMGYVIGGMKTENGKNRVVPIHPLVAPLIKERLKQNGEFLFDKMSYATYRAACMEIFRNMDTPHVPHDARRTFVTLAKRFGVDEYALKRMVGHSIKDITEDIYTERPIGWLSDEIKKIKIDETNTPLANRASNVQVKTVLSDFINS